MASLVLKPKNRGELLNHILDIEDLPAIVQSLDVDVLTRLIDHIGLEDSAPIVSAASAQQLKGVLDQDLWQSQSPGQNEQFDAGRFCLWVEILVENGPAPASRKLMEMDEDLAALGLSRLALVVDRHDPALRSTKVLEDSLYQEFGHYFVIARDEAGWDALCALLAELNESDDDMLFRLLHRCCLISEDFIENNGDLYHVLTSGEMLEEDVVSERQERREGLGFVTPSSAAGFLHQARSASLDEIMALSDMDPYTRAWFQGLERQNQAGSKQQTGTGGASVTALPIDDPKVVRFIKTLQNADVLTASDQKMIGYDAAEPDRHHIPLANAMRRINQEQPELYFERLNELSYLSNTLVSGCGFQGRRFTPQEAIEAAMSVCNLGSEHQAGTGAGDDDLAALLAETSLVKLFRAGWKILFDDVVMSTARTVLHAMDRHKKEAAELIRPAELLRACISEKRPWEFSDQIDSLLLYFDGGLVTAAEKLMQEYPTLTPAVCKMGGHRDSPFIRSRMQILTVRRFLKKGLKSGGTL